LGAVEDASSGECIPAPIFTAVALVRIGLGCEGVGDDPAVYFAFHEHLVKDKTLVAFTAVALNHSCRKFCLQALYLLALEIGVGVGAASGAYAGD